MVVDGDVGADDVDSMGGGVAFRIDQMASRSPSAVQYAVRWYMSAFGSDLADTGCYLHGLSISYFEPALEQSRQTAGACENAHSVHPVIAGGGGSSIQNHGYSDSHSRTARSARWCVQHTMI